MSYKTLLATFAIIFIPFFVLFFVVIFNQKSSEKSSANIAQFQKKQYDITKEKKEPIGVMANILPQFSMKLLDEKFQHIWKAKASERNTYITTDIDRVDEKAALASDVSFDDTKREVVVTPRVTSSVKPGLYAVDITVKTLQGQEVTIMQDFTWGVLAINTDKDTYVKGSQVKIGMAVLDDLGQTKCIMSSVMLLNTARVWLTITSPSGKTEKFSTDDKTISGSPDCKDRNYTNKADFLAQTDAEESGKYTMHMESETVRGRRSIDDVFFVRDSQPDFAIERSVYPTRIYPRYSYPVVLSISLHKEYSGKVFDIVPSSFIISDISEGGKVEVLGNMQKIVWDVSWKNGEQHTLNYAIKFPPVTPEFYLIGPFTIGRYTEARSWQVASDSIFSLVQEAHNTATTGTTVTATFSSGATLNNLIVLLCYRDQNTAWNTPAGYTRRYRVTSAPRLYHFDRLATAGMTTATCTTSTSNGEIAAQVLEFSGNSTSGYFDKTATTHNSATCNSGAHQETSNSLTPTNPDELLVSAFASNNGSLTISGHLTISGASSTGFTDTDTTGGSDGFNQSSSSYDSAWGEAVNNPPVSSNDRVTWSGAGGTCSSGLVAYNAALTLSQGSYQFFDNADSLTPGTTLAAENTAITLNQPNYPFRLRMLVDADSPSGTTLAIASADLRLQYAELPVDLNCANGTYQPVSTSSAIAYNVNPSTRGMLLPPITATANDPADTPTYTTVLENYVELYLDDNPEADVLNKQNTIGNNQAAMWDFSLVDASDDSVSKTYCLALFDSSGGTLNAYLNYPKVTTILNDVVIRGGSNIRGGTLIR